MLGGDARSISPPLPVVQSVAREYALFHLHTHPWQTQLDSQASPHIRRILQAKTYLVGEGAGGEPPRAFCCTRASQRKMVSGKNDDEAAGRHAQQGSELEARQRPE